MTVAPDDHLSRDPSSQFEIKVIPLGLRDRPQWVCWKYEVRGGKRTKCPYDPKTGRRAQPNDPSTWGTLDEALAMWRRSKRYDGIGYMFSADDPFTGIDLDKCIDEDGTIVPAAQEIINEFASYTEISPSRCGVKIWIIGAKPCTRCRSKVIEGIKEIEIYDNRRFFAVTASHLAGSPLTIEPRQPQLDALCNRLWPPKKTCSREPVHGGGFVGDDHLLIEQAFKARNGGAFRALWEGDISMYGGDDSAADMALCVHLAFWTGRDPVRMDRLFRQSKLYREKWERTDYRERTITKGVEMCTSVYQGPAKPKVKTTSDEFGLEGPRGLRLIVLSVNRSPTRNTARFAVAVDGQDTGMEMTATDTTEGRRKAARELIEIVAGVNPDIRDDGEVHEDIRQWLRTILTSKKLTGLSDQLNRDREEVKTTSAGPVSPSVFDIATPYLTAALGFAFVDASGEIWSERFGRCFDRNEFVSHIPPELLTRASAGHNFAAPTEHDPTKPIRHLQAELKVCWAHLLDTLPDEIHATALGPASKAARKFRDSICQLWLTPETWIKIEGGNGQPGHVERMSLASRARELSSTAFGRPPRWDRVLKGVNAFYRVEKSPDGCRVIWLGMRWDLCRGEIKGVNITTIGNQTDLTTLVNRYGLACADEEVTDRLREDGSQRRVCVLSRSICDHLIACVDDESNDPDTPPVTANGVPPVTGLGDGMRFNPETGEVL